MTDNKPQPSHPPQPAPPKPTDEQRVSEQVGVTDMTTTAGEALSGFFPFGGPVRFFGTTDFENHQLNDMIDLVAHANPEHLTSAGDALFRARDAIKKAAQELQANVRAVHWEGEAGNAFRAWGDKLAGHSQKLSDFADVAAVQISAAGSGLASVSKAMPQRDQRAQPVKVADIPPTKRVAGNAEYEAAVKVEKDRQEAINQMNRLSSFYSVSEQTLAAQQPPVFEPMPQVGVPQPLPGGGDPVIPGRAPDHTTSAHAHTAHSGDSSSRGFVEPMADHARTDTPVHPHEQATGGALPLPDHNAGTQLNSVTDLAPTTAAQVAPATPQVPKTAGPVGGPVLPLMGSPWNQTAGDAARAPRGVGGLPAQARAGSAGRQGISGTSGAGRSASGPVERPASTAQGLGRGATSTAGQSPMGRGVSGGTPRAGGAGSARAGSPAGTGRSNGIVGGRPNAGASESATSRAPRRAVVGGEAGAPAKPVGGPGQRGVVGATKSASSGAGQKSRPPMGNPDGIVGAPRGRTVNSRSGRNAFTKGGEGLVREQAPSSEGDDASGLEAD
ncbi:WXG100 family type VII secretion target [Streptomyces sp. SDr-06]|uniref:WXG100 family type VII secretion target n=1 Tax=Streptomyces sp. SDr-06 TaxID=2267702 RepID=UPI00167A356F|nr:WXG100 family type VII secretion target [Streptomyces sp. SDr-06]